MTSSSAGGTHTIRDFAIEERSDGKYVLGCEAPFLVQNRYLVASHQLCRNIYAHLISFLLLADSRASFQIEGEQPPRGRLER